ncbi:MAG: adenosylcobinamide-GDP ribazoletransferase [Curvibacter sp. RIFCSPHIGHO2_12_FULL_63_18]|uniref:adenosylcobinamide-GDP ribazoletransferase n=1 Tax=Rhodoferax sp. TaxID=50421 RepID=UPI0008BEA49E|nr:adenosylcobinamide-GDP ribazoletransferase [Rhodoferax sp.]OGO96996.1 MAG: adenosylcobinamide-GDP ribazoletransferase [Curvibacter sp. GWA2_63_95]OGP01173.1 MAG: adenosylcobinamide-GDP ribazoletransferase [Curvibacter sp. RIFCSPHIGHO2_12_FULL_63_18]HCX79981.1 adenosylcobinamide-GDP ribazoletransferase [Rhodoferax sp.]
MSQFLRHYLLSLQFFTRVPVTGRLADWVGFSPAMLRASAAHLPGVGWLVGGVVALASWLLLALLPASPFAPLVAAVLGTVLSVLITGAFHEDGLADVADGLGGTQNRERALEIMKDSRVGAFGAIAVVLALLAKVGLLALLGSLHGAVLCVALFTGHVVSRFWPLLTIRLLPHVGDVAGSKSKPLADQISLGSLWVAVLWSFSALALVLIAQAATILIAFGWTVPTLLVWLAAGTCASGLAWLGMLRWFARRLQGFTGDCLGATQQVCELAFYLGLALAWSAVSRGTLA